MAKKQSKGCERKLLTWFMLGGVILLFAPRNLTSKFQLTFAYIFHRPLSIGRSLVLSAHARQSSTDRVSRSKYNQLRNHLANVIQWLHQERRKVDELSGLRNRTALEGSNFVLADVITASISSSYDKLVINRGISDGLAKGQFVLSDYSIIGTISDVDSHTAQVKLVTDPTSKIPVKIAETDTAAIMQGSGNNCAKVELLSRKHNIKIGDVVCAQKKPGLLGVPIIVGTVTQCKAGDKNPLLWDIRIKPACDVRTLNRVAVIVTNKQE